MENRIGVFEGGGWVGGSVWPKISRIERVFIRPPLTILLVEKTMLSLPDLPFI